MAEEAKNGTSNGSEVSKAVITSGKACIVVDELKANDAVKFYKAAFGAEEVSRVSHTKRKAEQEVPLVLSVEMKLGDMVFLVSGLTDDSPVKSASAHVFCVETENVEAVIAQTVAAGAIAEDEIVEGEGACCGGRVGKVKDPFGNLWMICSPSNKSADVAA